jgi:hypothetical protein
VWPRQAIASADLVFAERAAGRDVGFRLHQRLAETRNVNGWIIEGPVVEIINGPVILGRRLIAVIRDINVGRVT